MLGNLTIKGYKRKSLNFWKRNTLKVVIQNKSNQRLARKKANLEDKLSDDTKHDTTAARNIDGFEVVKTVVIKWHLL